MKRLALALVKRFPLATVPTVLVPTGPVVDCHQHLWPEAFVDELRRRRRGPRLTGWTLHLDGEPTYEVDPADHDLTARRHIDEADEVDLSLISLSASLGIETMDPDESRSLLDAFHGLADEIDAVVPAKAGAMHGGYGLWASCSLVEPDLEGLSLLVAHDRVHGLQVPANALATPRDLDALLPVLAVAEKADVPVLVHPGPAAQADTGGLPAWWPAMTSYLAQQSAAWHSWRVAGREQLPSLRVAFAALAGLAPLHHERLHQRGGVFGAIDRFVFYETSSYGTRAVDAMVRVVGIDPLVHGSDRPNAQPTDPELGDAFAHALFVSNPAHLLDGGMR